MPQRSLNFLLITSDQQRADTIGLHNAAIRTPNLDRLAKSGMLFNRGYTVNPVCTPSRVSMLTGQYPSRHGCYHVGTGLPEGYEPNVPTQLARAGYFTGLLGKGHFQPCLDPASFEAAPHIHDRDYFRRWPGPYYGFEHARLVIGHTSEMHGSGMHYGVFLEDRGIDVRQHFGIHDYRDIGPWSLPAEVHGSAWVANETLHALDLAQRKDQPFFLWSSFQDPHNPLVVPEPWASMYRPEDMPEYALDPAELAGKPWFYRTLAEARTNDDLADCNWSDVTSTALANDGRNREALAIYYGMISLMDHHIGHILDGLEARGLAENTVVVFASDHGDYTGNHGLWGKGMPAYEDTQRVPFIVRHPNCRSAGQTSQALQSVVDIGPSFLAMAGIAPAPGTQGMDQTPAWLNADASVRSCAMLEFRPGPEMFMQRTYVYAQHKLVIYQGLPELGELYDLAADPDQHRNLFQDTGSRTLRDELVHRALDAELAGDGTLRPRTSYA